MEGWWERTVREKTGNQGALFHSFAFFPPLGNITTAMHNNMNESHNHVEPKKPGT